MSQKLKSIITTFRLYLLLFSILEFNIGNSLLQCFLKQVLVIRQEIKNYSKSFLFISCRGIKSTTSSWRSLEIEEPTQANIDSTRMLPGW